MGMLCLIPALYDLRNVEHIQIHTSTMKNNISILPNNEITDLYAFQKINENILQTYNLHINHYMIQSLNWFMKVKTIRGDADYQVRDNLRDYNYFKAYDYNANNIDDFELANKKYY